MQKPEYILLLAVTFSCKKALFTATYSGEGNCFCIINSFLCGHHSNGKEGLKCATVCYVTT